jgi:hypothetical protein
VKPDSVNAVDSDAGVATWPSKKEKNITNNLSKKGNFELLKKEN